MANQRRAEATRESILQAAVDVFSIRGYEATGVAEICETAGTSKGAFYHHFPSKQSLYLELLQDWLSSIDLQFARIREESDTVPEALTMMTSLFTEVFSSADKQVPIFLEFLTTAARDTAVWRSAIEPYRRYRSYFAEMLNQGVTAGQVRPCDVEAMSQLLVSLAVGLILQGVLDPSSGNWSKIAEEAISLFVREVLAIR